MTTAKIIDYRDLIAKSTRGFVGRGWVRDAVDASLAAAGPRYFLLLGEPGCGKTACLADLVRARGYPHHFIGKGSRRDADADVGWRNPVRFAESVGYQLLRDHGGWVMDWEEWGISVIQEVKELQGLLAGAEVGTLRATPRPPGRPLLSVRQEVERFGPAAQVIGVYVEKFRMDVEQVVRQLLVKPLRAVALRRPKEPVVVVVDGLDEAEEYSNPRHNICKLLPDAELPANVRFLVSSQHGRHLTDDFLGRSRVLWLSEDEQGRQDPRAHQDARAYALQLAGEGPVREALAARRVDPAVFAEKVADASRGNFLYLFHYADGVRQGDQALLDLSALPPGLY